MHLDFKEEYLGNEFGHASVARNISHLGVPLIQVGIRSGARDEYTHALGTSVIYTMEQVRREGIKEILRDIESSTRGKAIYLSIDGRDRPFFCTWRGKSGALRVDAIGTEPLSGGWHLMCLVSI